MGAGAEHGRGGGGVTVQRALLFRVNGSSGCSEVLRRLGWGVTKPSAWVPAHWRV